jgi:hypothetical protein
VGRLPAAKLEADFRESLVPRDLTLLRTRYEPLRRPPEAVRPLPEAEVHMLRAQLTTLDTVEGRAAAAAELDRIGPGAEQNPEAVLLRAAWLHASDQTDAAKTLLEGALRVRPGDPRLLCSLGYVLLAAASAHASPPASVVAVLKPIETKLMPVARTAAQDRLIALSAASRGALPVARAFAKRAIERDPNCVPCLILMAQLLDEQGQVADALATATLAQGLLHEGERSKMLSQMIRSLKAKVDGGGAGKPGR